MRTVLSHDAFPPQRSDAILIRRYLECAAFVLLWMAGGFYFQVSPIAYQMWGVPLIAGFQLAIARRPLRQLWAFDAEKFRVDWRTGALALLLFAACAALLLCGLGRTGKAPDAHWLLAVVAVAAIPAAFALREQRADNLRRAFGLIALAVVLRVAWRVGWAPIWEVDVVFPLSKLPDFLTDSICEFVALFLIDEVAFRGALDPHLAAAGSGRVHAWSSATFVSILWSAWHFQVYHPDAKTFLQLLTQTGPQDFLPVIYGVVLSFCARRSRTLAPTAAIHAAGNGYVLTLIK